MISRQLWFLEPFQVEIRDAELQPPGPREVLVKNLYSGISGGTEMLVYRGQVPDTMALDESLAAFGQQKAAYPVRYGYACVGRIEQIGKEVDGSRAGQTVFSFQPHASHHICALEDVIPLPDGMDPRAAVFLANMETAVNLVLDGNPRIGSRVVVMGQGIVGLLVCRLLAEFPLSNLYAVEPMAGRRPYGEQTGVHGVFSPDSGEDMDVLEKNLKLEDSRGGADLVFELTGSPEALNRAVSLCGFSGRIVVGSWYGTKSAPLNLGERFHRNRMEIIGSQVSTIMPELGGRWDRSRRFSLAWDMIGSCRPERFITHVLPFSSAAEAYRLLDESPAEALQVIFDYTE